MIDSNDTSRNKITEYVCNLVNQASTSKFESIQLRRTSAPYNTYYIIFIHLLNFNLFFSSFLINSILLSKYYNVVQSPSISETPPFHTIPFLFEWEVNKQFVRGRHHMFFLFRLFLCFSIVYPFILIWLHILHTD